MSEMPLLEFVAKWWMEEWAGESNYLELRKMLEARIRRAEAAERLAEAWLACDEDDISNATWDAFQVAISQYRSEKEAVRKLEETM